GSCEPVTSEVLDCKTDGYEGELVEAGLVAYSCTGDVRPDLEATYDDGVPRGVLCAERGPLGQGVALGEGGEAATLDADSVGYCCTEEPVDCAYDPVSDCQSPSYGYQCWGSNRPESLNPALSCSNGNREGEHKEIVNYCCTGEALEPDCYQRDVVPCSER